MAELVSVCCVTKDRPQFIRALVKQFDKQGYPNLELVIIASGQDISHLIPDERNIRLFRFEGTIGAARNRAVREARGRVCVQFDDDDWQHPHRVERQLKHMEITGAAVVGIQEVTFHREGDDHAWRILDRMEHSAGACLAYRRDFALAHPFVEGKGQAEDTLFVESAIEHDMFSNISGFDICVLRNHDQHDSNRELTMAYAEAGRLSAFFDDMPGVKDNWRKIPVERIAHIIQ